MALSENLTCVSFLCIDLRVFAFFLQLCLIFYIFAERLYEKNNAKGDLIAESFSL